MHWRPRLRTPSTVPLLGFCLPVAFPSSEDETDFAASPLSRLNAPDFRVAPAVQNARAPAFSSPDAVALSLARPPGHFEVLRLRRSSSLGTCAALAHFFASSAGQRLRHLERPLRAVTTSRPEWNQNSGSAPFRQSPEQLKLPTDIITQCDKRQSKLSHQPTR
jgi:hypothetical protein